MENFFAILFTFTFSFLFGFTYRSILKKLPVKKVKKLNHNIGKKDRMLRTLIGFFLFILAAVFNWNIILLFVAGFAFFEAIFSWCGFYAAIGKNTCPIK